MLAVMYHWDKFALETVGELLPINFIEETDDGFRVGHTKPDGEPLIVQETGEAVRRLSWTFTLDKEDTQWQ